MRANRPRLTHFEEQATEVVWAGICALDEAEQHLVLEALRERLGRSEARESPHAVKVARAIAGLREVAGILGHSPSVTEYRIIRNERIELDLPPDGSVRRWLGGGWNHALGQARLESVPEADAAVRALGPRFSRRELIVALRECAAELDRIPSLHDYLSWSRRRDVTARPGRRARSQSPFIREFGSWWQAIADADLAEDAEQARVGGDGRLVRRFDKESCQEALQELVEQNDGARPSHPEYAREREKRTASGETALPSHSTLVRLFGSWSKAWKAYDEWRARQ